MTRWQRSATGPGDPRQRSGTQCAGRRECADEARSPGACGPIRRSPRSSKGGSDSLDQALLVPAGELRSGNLAQPLASFPLVAQQRGPSPDQADPDIYVMNLAQRSLQRPQIGFEGGDALG